MGIHEPIGWTKCNKNSIVPKKNVLFVGNASFPVWIFHSDAILVIP